MLLEKKWRRNGKGNADDKRVKRSIHQELGRRDGLQNMEEGKWNEPQIEEARLLQRRREGRRHSRPRQRCR